MTEDGNNVQQPFAGGIENLDSGEQSLVASLRAPVAFDHDAFDARVMAAVRRERVHGTPASSQHRRGIFGIASVGALVAAVATFVVLNGRAVHQVRDETVVPIAASPASHAVRFTLVTSGASRVTLAGSFNGWNTRSIPLRRTGTDTWTADVPLGAGRYAYQFVIDGTRWVTDPRAPRDAGADFGPTNSVVTVAMSGSA